MYVFLLATRAANDAGSDSGRQKTRLINQLLALVGEFIYEGLYFDVVVTCNTNLTRPNKK